MSAIVELKSHGKIDKLSYVVNVGKSDPAEKEERKIIVTPQNKFQDYLAVDLRYTPDTAGLTIMEVEKGLLEMSEVAGVYFLSLHDRTVAKSLLNKMAENSTIKNSK